MQLQLLDILLYIIEAVIAIKSYYYFFARIILNSMLN